MAFDEKIPVSSSLSEREKGSFTERYPGGGPAGRMTGDIVPAGNGKKVLGEAVQGVQAPSFQRWSSICSPMTTERNDCAAFEIKHSRQVVPCKARQPAGQGESSHSQSGGSVELVGRYVPVISAESRIMEAASCIAMRSDFWRCSPRSVCCPDWQCCRICGWAETAHRSSG